MTTGAVDPIARPSLRIRGEVYPILLPRITDPRLHLASVIITLQVLGQVAFDFRLSIAQILVSLVTAAILEIGITMRRQHVLMWPASALLTGNGVAFVLRVPGTEHGDWWSMRGWWLFAGTSAVALLSKYVIRYEGRHVFNPSNIGLVLCFLLFGPELADPLDLWWGPLTWWLVLALVVIVAGGLAILTRLHLLSIAILYWLSFAVGIGVIAASGHEMFARWHVGPITGFDFWRVLVFSPEVLVFLFFMITDPRTIPDTGRGRSIYAVTVALLSVVLIAPQTTEFWTKVAILGSLTIVCASRPFAIAIAARSWPTLGRRTRVALAVVGAIGLAALIAIAGAPARPAEAAAVDATGLPPITIVPSTHVASTLDETSANQIAAAVVAAAPAGVTDVRITMELGTGQEPPIVVATAEGPVERTFELRLDGTGYVVTGTRGEHVAGDPAATSIATGELPGVRVDDVASQVGIDFQQGAFRFEPSTDRSAMLGGGVCWLDADGDGRLDLFAVNGYSDRDLHHWNDRGGLPRSALYRNTGDGFVDVSARAGADLPLRGNGCVAGDLDLDGDTDLYVTTSGYNVGTDGYDALLWNDGDGTFSEGAQAAGIREPGWHAGAAIGDVNGDDLPDLLVTGYADVNAPIAGSSAGFPTDHQGVRDLLYLNEGRNARGRTTFREVGRQAGIDPAGRDHGLGVVFTDANGDGRLDLYVANDADPNRLYLNEVADGPLGFAFRERGRAAGVDDPNAGMGIAAADYDGDGRGDLFVTNAHGQLHAAYRGTPQSWFAWDGERFRQALDLRYAGWGVTWADLDLDGTPELLTANGAIPFVDHTASAEPLTALRPPTAERDAVDVSASIGLDAVAPVNGRGVAAADYDDDGDVDVAVNTIGGKLVLLRTSGADGHWLNVRLRSFAPGAVVTVVLPDGRRLVREVHVGSSYLSTEDPRVHFGLGDATSARELIVRFPDGRVVRRADIAADRTVTV